MKKFRLYVDKDSEEIWLNEMAEKGWCMKKYFLGVYTFEQSEERYVYRIDLLKNWEGDREDFVTFMEESGVEFVDQWYRWVFLRKKNQDGVFELYSDQESLLDHYTRIKKFIFIAFIIEIICAILQLPSIIFGFSIMNLVCLVIIMFFVIALLGALIKTSSKINQLNLK